MKANSNKYASTVARKYKDRGLRWNLKTQDYQLHSFKSADKRCKVKDENIKKYIKKARQNQVAAEGKITKKNRRISS